MKKLIYNSIALLIIIIGLTGCAQTSWRPVSETNVPPSDTQEFPIKNKAGMIVIDREAIKRAGITETYSSEESGLLGGAKGMTLIDNPSTYTLRIQETIKGTCIVRIWVDGAVFSTAKGLAEPVFTKIQEVLNDPQIMEGVAKTVEEAEKLKKERFAAEEKEQKEQAEEERKQLGIERQANIAAIQKIIDFAQQKFDANKGFNNRSKIVLEEVVIFIDLCTGYLKHYSGIWSKAIEEGNDFNAVLFRESNRLEKYGYLEGVRNGYEHVTKLMKSFEQNLPDKDKEVFNLILEDYAIYSELKELTLSPKGTVVDFNKKINDLKGQHTRVKSKLDILLSQ
jgi:hypothetical protein